MARKKNASAAASVPSENDPLGWLFVNPPEPGFEPEPGFAFGVLRKSFRGRANSAEEFCRRKAQPVMPAGDPAAVPWNVTAAKMEVLLPNDMDDRYADPRLLCQEVDARSLPTEQALLTYVTLSFPDARRLHTAREAARAFAMTCFVEGRSLPVVLIQHAPHLAGSSNAVHCHLLIVPRAADGLGLRGFDQDMVTDRGQQIIHREWLAYKAGAVG